MYAPLWHLDSCGLCAASGAVPDLKARGKRGCARHRPRALLASVLILVALSTGWASIAAERQQRRGSGRAELVGTVAVLPVWNPGGFPAPVEQIRSDFANKLSERGFRILDDDVLREFMRQQRMRYTGGIASKMGQALAAGTGADVALVTTLDLYDEENSPKAAMSARIVTLAEPPAIIWADSAVLAGDEKPGFLGLGRIGDIAEILDRVTTRLADAAAGPFSGGWGSRAEPRDARRPPPARFRPEYHYRTAGVALTGARAGTVAVLPFANASSTRNAGEIVSDQLVRSLVRSGANVIDPGEVRLRLLNARLIQPDGPSVPQAGLLRLLLDADLVFFGDVSVYRERRANLEYPEVRFSVQALDTATRRVVWSSFSANAGDDGVFFFEVGRVPTAHELASTMVRAVARIAAETLGEAETSVVTEARVNPATVPESGGDVTFEIRVANSGVDPLRLTALVDSSEGNLDGIGSCSLPQTLSRAGRPGDRYTCSYTAFVDGDYPGIEISRVTATLAGGAGESIRSQGSATITFSEVFPEASVDIGASASVVPETGGEVGFSVSVTNKSREAGTLLRLTDEFGLSLDGRGDCTLPQSLGPAGTDTDTYSCSFIEQRSGDYPGDWTETVGAEIDDGDGNKATPEARARVFFDDVRPEALFLLTADPIAVPETGGEVSYRVTVTNRRLEQAFIEHLLGADGGPIGDCSAQDWMLSPAGQQGDSYSCGIRKTVSGDFPGDDTTAVSLRLRDDDGNAISRNARATVFLRDVLPAASVALAREPAAVPETGGTSMVTMTVVNHSAEAAVLSAIEGELDPAAGDCRLPQPLAPSGEQGDRYACTIPWFASGDHPGTATANLSSRVNDDDGNSVDAAGTVDVTLEDVLPRASLDVRPKPSTAPEDATRVTISVTIANESPERATLTSLLLSMNGDLLASDECSSPRVLEPSGQPGSSFTCETVQILSGNRASDFEITTRGVVADDDGNEIELAESVPVRFERRARDGEQKVE